MEDGWLRVRMKRMLSLPVIFTGDYIMQLEHIARGRYILNMTDHEAKEITAIATSFYHGNKSRCIANIIETGVGIYNQLIEEGCEHDQEFKDSLKIVTEHLANEPDGKEHDISCPQYIGEVQDGQLKDCTCKGRKCGSAIQSGD